MIYTSPKGTLDDNQINQVPLGKSNKGFYTPPYTEYKHNEKKSNVLHRRSFVFISKAAVPIQITDITSPITSYSSLSFSL